MHTKDYYKILELHPSASLKEIKTAYRRLAHQYHPDKNGNDLYAAARFEIIKEAYEVLSNPSKKEYYLQQRWYDQSIGKKTRDTIITPVTVLKQLLELNKYISGIDVHRMDKEGLYEYICNVLTDEVIEKLNTFNETDINKTIVDSVLHSSRPLPFLLVKALAEKLVKINADELTSQSIRQYIQHSRNADNWNKYRVWLLLLVVIFLCFLIYRVSR